MGNQYFCFFFHFVSTTTVTKVSKDTSVTEISSKLADFLKKKVSKNLRRLISVKHKGLVHSIFLKQLVSLEVIKKY